MSGFVFPTLHLKQPPRRNARVHAYIKFLVVFSTALFGFRNRARAHPDRVLTSWRVSRPATAPDEAKPAPEPISGIRKLLSLSHATKATTKLE